MQIIDSRLAQSLGLFFPATVSVVAKKYTSSASNQKTLSGTTPIDGLTDIPSRIGPIIDSRPTDEQIRTGHVREQVRRRHVVLQGYYPQIQTDSMLCITSETSYEIRGVEADGSLLLTRLRLEEIRP